MSEKLLTNFFDMEIWVKAAIFLIMLAIKSDQSYLSLA